MSITHSFVSAKSDSADSTLVRPSNWNATHTINSIHGPDYTVTLNGSTFTATPNPSIAALGGIVYTGTDIAAVLTSILGNASVPGFILFAYIATTNMGSNLALPHRQIHFTGMGQNATVIQTNGFQMKDDGNTGLGLWCEHIQFSTTGTYTTGNPPIIFNQSSQGFYMRDFCLTVGATTGDATTSQAQFGGSGASGLPCTWDNCVFQDNRSSANMGGAMITPNGENPRFWGCGMVMNGTYGCGTVGIFDLSHTNGRVSFKNLDWYFPGSARTYASVFYAGGGVNIVLDCCELPSTGTSGVTLTNTAFAYSASFMEIIGLLQLDTGGGTMGPDKIVLQSYSGSPPNRVWTLQWNEPFIDCRRGLIASDSAAKTLLTTSNSALNWYVGAQLRIYAVIYPAVFGAASTYVIKYTENSVVNTTTLTTATLNVPVMTTIVCNPDLNTAVTAQYTEGVGATSNVLCEVWHDA